jgi:hypothetical protein
MNGNRISPAGRVSVEHLGLLGTKHVLDFPDLNHCIVNKPFFLGHSGITFEGMDLKISIEDSDYRLNNQLPTGGSKLEYLATCSSSEKVSLNIGKYLGDHQYQLTEDTSSADGWKVALVLTNNRGEARYLHMQFPSHKIYIARPLDSLLVAFCYYLSLDFFFPRLRPRGFVVGSI